jgi:XRE family transcriptional regulator, regulator of sulfur utilization
VNSSEHGDDLGRLAAGVGAAVREHRTARGMSLGELARACGLSRTILSRIESGAGNPSIETLWRISKALEVPLGALLGEERVPRVRAIPAREGEPLRADSGMYAWLLHAHGRRHRSEMYDLELPKGTEQATDGHLPGTEELVLCTRGRAFVGPLGEEVELRAGDAVWFAADVPHRYVARTDARILDWVLYEAGGGV